jgi:hypothetical protein
MWVLAFIYGLIILGNFVCQVYVGRLVFREEGTARIVLGVLRGTPTFVRGWRRADELGIRDVMVFWSFLVVMLLIPLCLTLAIVAIAGPPGSR